jgi:hypothetical protein
MPLHEARISGVRVKQARANIFLAGIIRTLFSFILRPSQAMAGNNAFQCEHAIDGATSGLFKGAHRARPKEREPGALLHR